MMNRIEDMLKQADFSKETDLKQRLHKQLFGRQVLKFPGTGKALDDDMLEMLSAAGEIMIHNPENN